MSSQNNTESLISAVHNWIEEFTLPDSWKQPVQKINVDNILQTVFNVVLFVKNAIVTGAFTVQGHAQRYAQSSNIVYQNVLKNVLMVIERVTSSINAYINAYDFNDIYRNILSIVQDNIHVIQNSVQIIQKSVQNTFNVIQNVIHSK